MTSMQRTPIGPYSFKSVDLTGGRILFFMPFVPSLPCILIRSFETAALLRQGISGI